MCGLREGVQLWFVHTKSEIDEVVSISMLYVVCCYQVESVCKVDRLDMYRVLVQDIICMYRNGCSAHT
jgi:hypothetical protein